MSISKKLQNITTLLLVLVSIQSNILPLALTFGEKHDLSLVRQNGEIYLVLEHEHLKHSHSQKHHHEHFSKHGDSHPDHVIKLADSKFNDVLVTAKQIKIFDFTFHYEFSAVTASLLVSLVPRDFMPTLERDRTRHSDQDLIKLKYAVQFLA